MLHYQTPILHTPVGSYYGQDILEGFAADAEYLGKLNTGKPHFDQGFYRLCKLDNLYIFEITNNSEFKIPTMSLQDLNRIIFSKTKLGKACDV